MSDGRAIALAALAWLAAAALGFAAAQAEGASRARITWPAFAAQNAFEPAAPALAKPGFLETVTNAAGLPLTRLGGSSREMITAVPLPPAMRQHADHRIHWYSRNSATSATGRYAISWAEIGLAALWRLRPKIDFVAWLTLPRGASPGQAIWDKADDETFWWTRKNEIVRTRFDARTFETAHEVVRKLDGYATLSFGDGEGDISRHGRKVALQGRRWGDRASWLIAYDIATDAVVGERRLEGDIDALSVDPTGAWLAWMDAGVRNRFSVPWGDIAAEPHAFERSGRHGDFVVGADGTVWFATTSGKGVRLWRVDRTNEEGRLHWSVPSSDGHISGLDSAPGKFTYTRYNGGQILLFDLARPNRQAILGYTRHCEGDEFGAPLSYAREPRGSAAMDGRYLVFASDWCAGAAGAPRQPEMYVIELPLERGE
ncbi:MAG: hypothetical protein ACR2PO_10225 [Methyloligellaceae bacterium]